jgi:hypothetical protein
MSAHVSATTRISKGDCKSMSIRKGMKPGQESEDHLAEPGVDSTTDIHTQKLTLAGHVIATIKILAGFALVAVALWAVEFWTSAG